MFPSKKLIKNVYFYLFRTKTLIFNMKKISMSCYNNSKVNIVFLSCYNNSKLSYIIFGIMDTFIQKSSNWLCFNNIL